MKTSLFILILLASFGLFAQEKIMDSIAIPEVSINAQQKIEMAQKMDSMALKDPTNLDLGELLQKRSHIFVKSYGIGSIASPSIRGSGSSHTQVYWNGMLLNSAMNGMLDLSLYPTIFMDEVDVNYGISSLKLGSGGIGGAISMRNKVGFRKKSNVIAGQSFGSFGQQTSTLQLRLGNERFQSISRIFYRKAENNFEYKDLTTEGFPKASVKNAGLEQKGLMQSLHYKLKENQLLEGHFWLYQSDRNLPSLITLRENVENQSDQSIKGLLKYRLYHDKWRLYWSTSFLHDRLIYRNERASVLDTSKTRAFLNFVEFHYQLHSKLKFYSRIDYQLHRATISRQKNTLNREVLSFYKELNYSPSESWKLSGALRQEYILGEDQVFLPTISAHYTPRNLKSTTFFMKAGKNWKYPTLNDLYFQPLGNENLKPELNRTAELGVSFIRWFDRLPLRMATKASVYHSIIDDYILWQPTAFGYWKAVNLNKVRARGVEFEGKLEQTDAKVDKELVIRYTYTKSENLEQMHSYDQSVGKQLIYIPINQFNLNAAANYRGYRLSYNHNFVDTRFSSSDNERFVPAYALSDCSISKKLEFKNHNLELTFSILNIFDVEYQAIEWRPMPNRNYQLRLIYALN